MKSNINANFSDFGNKLAGDSGIFHLMEDLNEALNNNPDLLFLGGGNPANISEATTHYNEIFEQLIRQDSFKKSLATYDAPAGNQEFIETLVKFFNDNFNLNITNSNIALTNGSQNSFFLIFNLLTGSFNNKPERKVLLPIVPEYIGYADSGINPDQIQALAPLIKIDSIQNSHRFQYKVDYENLRKTLKQDQKFGVAAISRPTNPTSNVLDDHEVTELNEILKSHGTKLLIDNAYGFPFPNVIFKDVKLQFDENMILTFSLSKLGLPGLRTGIVIASEEIIAAVSRMNAIINLSPGGIGPSFANILFKKDIISFCKDTITPHYKKKSQLALRTFEQHINKDVSYYFHKSEGAFFLWLWLPKLPITSQELYLRLKERNVLIVPGHYYFPGLDATNLKSNIPFEMNKNHVQQCLRISFAQSEQVITEGMKIIAQEINKF